MVDDERRCTDVLTQIASVHEALRAVGRELVRGHLMQCATPAASRGRNADAALYDEFLDLMYRHLR